MRRLADRLARWRAIASVAVLLGGLLVACAALAVELPIAIFGSLGRQDIRVLQQDRNGFVWAGTDTGLYVFDGVGFLRMDASQGFTPAPVTGMAEDAAGDLWVATQAGLQRRHQGRFAGILPEGRPLLADPGQTLALQPNGDLLVVSGHRLLVVSKQGEGQWTAQPLFSAQQRRQDASLDRIGIVAVQGAAVWFSCGDELCHVQQGQIRHFGPREGVPADTWQDILPARDGSVWVLGRHELLQQAAGASAFVEQHLPDGSSWIAGANGLLAQDANGNIVLGTKAGVLRLEGRAWKIFGYAQGIMPGNPMRPLSTVLADRDGSLWLGNPGWGVLHWAASEDAQNWAAWSGWGTPEYVERHRIDMLTLWQPDNDAGPYRYSKQRWPLTALPPDHAYLERIAPDGSIWDFHFDGKITRRAPGASRATGVATLRNFIRGVLPSREGTFWIYTLGGMDALNPKTGVVRQGENLPMGTSCSDAAEDATGHIWAVCTTGLFRYNGRRWELASIQLAGSTSAIAITPERIAITADGRMWIGAIDASLLVSQPIRSDALILRPVEASMQDNVRVDFIGTDKRGWLWVGDAMGLRVFDGSRWSRLTSRDGLLQDDAGDLSFHADDDGSVWVAMKIGLSHLLDPVRLLARRPWKTWVFAADYGGKDLLTDPAPSFDAGKAVVFRLAVTGNSLGHSVRYRYRLDGIDKSWRETVGRSVSYSIDQPGAYRFEVQAMDTDFAYTGTPATLAFTLAASWWRSPWMALLALPFLLLGIAWLWRWRSAVLIARNRQFEQALEQRTAQFRLALHARNDLLAKISHDLRSPLVNVIECVNQWCAGSTLRDYPRLIEQSIWQQIGLIDDLLEFAQDEHAHAELEEVVGYLHAFLADIVAQAALMAERGGNRFVHRFDDDLPVMVKADFRRLRQVLLNLLGNAAKFTHDGLVEFDVAVEWGDARHVRLRFSVRDNGIGIGAEKIESLMKPFVRGGNVAQREGKGLGLSIVAQWLERMHAPLQVRMCDGGGSEFVFVLYLATADESEVGSNLLDDDPMDTSLDGGGRAIVVVDDLPQNRDMLCDILDSYGFASFPAGSGEEALRIVEAQRPALVITDQYMPGMGGWALLAALRERHAGLPVILCSAALPRRPAIHASVRDFDASLLKPVSVRQLLRVIARMSGCA